VVTLTFKIQENNFKIVRGIKPDVFEVYRNDVLIPQLPSVKDYQNLLEKEILKILRTIGIVKQIELDIYLRQLLGTIFLDTLS
jgi:hypothetical protein